MSRILVVATTEFLTLVKTKAFIIGILMLPVMLGLSFGFQIFAAKHADVEDHAFAVIDHTGALYPAIAAAAEAHNRESGTGKDRTGPYFLPRQIDSGSKSAADVKADLSARVRQKELFAFVEIPSGVLDIKSTTDDQVNYYTETPSYDPLPNWLSGVLQREITARRFASAAVDPNLVAQLTRRARVTTLGLVERKADGTVSDAKQVNQIATFAVPFGMMYLLFIALMSSAPQLLTAVIEEKMSRISEVLISSITPTQLMLGKLLGVAGVAALLALIYLGGGVYALLQTGQFELVQPALLAWFVVFLLCAVLMFGSVFVAIGAACSDLKDSQSMMQPVMVFLLLPMFASAIVLRQPNSMVSVAASLFPTASPFLMLIRLAMSPPPPIWQVALSVVLTLTTTAVFIWAAARIFRIGLLMQGKPPNLPELLKWIRA
ncbi:MAG TPA: ABC transporter permease [Vicinamibacterales bacterium]|nr:ABC transporter permease [Vicinamibacterales bacterium]